MFCQYVANICEHTVLRTYLPIVIYVPGSLSLSTYIYTCSYMYISAYLSMYIYTGRERKRENCRMHIYIYRYLCSCIYMYIYWVYIIYIYTCIQTRMYTPCTLSHNMSCTCEWNSIKYDSLHRTAHAIIVQKCSRQSAIYTYFVHHIYIYIKMWESMHT